MGVNISGVVINKNFQDSLDDLSELLNCNLVQEDEILFEKAPSKWVEEEVCLVYFSEKGTLIFLHPDRCDEGFMSQGNKLLTFTLSESEMNFDLKYTQNAFLVRSITEIEGERIEDEGEILSVESISEDPEEIIWNQMEVLLGYSYWEIEADEKLLRFRIGKEGESPLFSKANQESNSDSYFDKDLPFDSKSDIDTVSIEDSADSSVKPKEELDELDEFLKGFVSDSPEDYEEQRVERTQKIEKIKSEPFWKRLFK